jgi:nicotinic acid mononucleotide adenylyltransferase
MGADLLPNYKYWDEYERLKNEKKFLVFKRQGY